MTRDEFERQVAESDRWQDRFAATYLHPFARAVRFVWAVVAIASAVGLRFREAMFALGCVLVLWAVPRAFDRAVAWSRRRRDRAIARLYEEDRP